jgi:7-cyano-7-deazaguanine tRNA-ribosyltransferase
LNYEVKYKDLMGRIGNLKTPHGKVKTPTLMPVVHPQKQILDLKKLGAELVITNAYIIYKDDNMKKKAIKHGIHDLINFQGPVVTDSGSFQLSEYGNIEVSNEEIINFQEEIGSDIGTSLDIPTPPNESRRVAEKDLEITIKRAEEALNVRKEMMLNSVVQGSTYLELRAKCAEILGTLDFQVHPIGGVVPLLESYQFSKILDIVMASVNKLPNSRPIHLMGAGHPMIFAFAVAIGCDLFDSAAYILYAEDDRFLMPNGTYRLENLLEMPCSCDVCNNFTPDDLRNMDKNIRTSLIAQHNLLTSFAEIRKIRQAIVDGRLFELIQQRCRGHPYLLDALRNLKRYRSILEEYDPVFKKSAFFYSGSESLERPEIYRHLKRIQRLPNKKRVILIPSLKKPYSNNLPKEILKGFQLNCSGKLGRFYHKIQNINKKRSDALQLTVVDVPFAIIPIEIDEIYPLAQNESPSVYDEDAKKFVKKSLKEYIKGFNEIIIHESIVKIFDLDSEFENGYQRMINLEIDDYNKIEYIADYQFGKGAGKALFKGNVQIIKSRKTGKIRHIYQENCLIATLRASDGVFVLSLEGAKRLHDYLEYPKNRVVVNSEAEPYVIKGKSIFAKFIIDCDINIRANEEVLIVNDVDDLLAFGKSLLNGKEMLDFMVGQAVKNRRGGK